MGGFSGNAVKDGDSFQLEFESYNFYVLFITLDSRIGNPKIIHRKDGEEKSAADDGLYGYNIEGIEQATESDGLRNPSESISSYKSYIRDSIPNDARTADLIRLLRDLEGSRSIRNIYDPLGFVLDLEYLENQYYQLRDKVNFVPYLKSYSNRISEYLKYHNDETIENQKVLRFLYSAAMGKLNTMRNRTNPISIVDLGEYIGTVQNHITKLREADSKISNTEYHENYKLFIFNRIETGAKFIEKQILPEINNVFVEMDSYIIKLVIQTIQRQHKGLMSIKDAYEDKERLKRSLLLRRVFIPVKFVSAMASLLSPVAKVLAIGATKIIDSIIHNKFNKGDTTKTKTLKIDGIKDKVANTEVQDSAKELSGEFKRRQVVFLDQLNYIADSFNEFSRKDNDMIEIEFKLNHFRRIIQEHMRKNTTILPVQIDRMRDELHTLIMQKRAKSQPKFGALELIDDTIRFLYHIERILSVTELSIDIYNQFKRDDERLEAVNEAIESLKDQLNMWKAHEQNIYNIVFPQIHEIEDMYNAMVMGLSGKSSMEFNTEKWAIQNMLRDVKVLFRKMSKDFNVQDALVRCIEKIDEGITVLIDLYDRIDSYIENIKLSSLIISLSSSRSRFSISTENPTLNNALMRLQQIVQTNLIIEQYEDVVHAFKQHQFPFADFYMAKYNLTSFQANETEIVIQKAVEHIEDLREQLKSSEISIRKYDREIFRDIEFSSRSSSAVQPFFVWENKDFKEEINKLLQGEEIMVKADITKDHTRNAVKFNEIGIYLKAANEDIQKQIDAELDKYSVTMSMIGNNHYRCGTRVYTISVDDNIVIEYSMKNGENGKPVMSNDVYRKIREKSYFLSPYTLWTINLSEGNFENLKKFENEQIDLELVGRGQFFKENGIIAHEVCNSELDSYYNLDDDLSYFKNSSENE